MAGAALGKLWDTNPRLAFALQAVVSVLLAVFFVVSLARHDWTVGAVVGAGLLLEAGTLVVFTSEAVSHGWTRSSW